MQKIGLKEMVVALRKELLEAQEEGAKQNLKFAVEEIDIEVELVTTKEGEGEGGVKFLVYDAKMKGKLAKARTHRLHLKLKPDTNGGDLKISRKDKK